MQKITIARLDSLREWYRPQELAIPTLSMDITLVGAVRFELALTRDCQYIVVYVNLHVLFLEARQIKGGRDPVSLLVFIDINTGE